MPSSPHSFDEGKHPRGQPDNAGKFKGKPLPTPPKASPRRVATRAEVERLQTVESQMARQVQTAVWLFVAACAAAVWLSLLPIGTAVQAVAWAAGGAALVLLAVRSTRLSRAWTARAVAQSAVEEAEAMERTRGPTS